MWIKGIVQSAELEEDPQGSESIRMVLKVQGVGAGQPRRLVVPYNLLLQDPSLDPDSIAGHAFEAEIAQAADMQWLVTKITFTQKRMLREKE